jgi:hypothetical protein
VTPGRRSSGGPRPSAWTVAGCLALGVLGTLTTLGCLLSIYVETSSFGGPAQEPRSGYMALLITGAVAGIGVPAAVCAKALGTSWRLTVIATAVAAVAVAVLLLGLG